MRFALLALLITACTTSMPAGGDDDDTSQLGFTPSNFDVSSLDFSNVGDLVFADESTWQTDLGGLLGAGNYNYQVIPQPNGLSLGVFTVNSIELSPNARIHVRGVNALVIVALDSISIDGELDANSQVQGAWTGPGGSAASDSNVKGLGAGGGGAGTPSAAAEVRAFAASVAPAARRTRRLRPRVRLTGPRRSARSSPDRKVDPEISAMVVRAVVRSNSSRAT
jgi:hypothetical protein